MRQAGLQAGWQVHVDAPAARHTEFAGQPDVPHLLLHTNPAPDAAQVKASPHAGLQLLRHAQPPPGLAWHDVVAGQAGHRDRQTRLLPASR